MLPGITGPPSWTASGCIVGFRSERTLQARPARSRCAHRITGAWTGTLPGIRERERRHVALAARFGKGLWPHLDSVIRTGLRRVRTVLRPLNSLSPLSGLDRRRSDRVGQSRFLPDFLR